MSLEKELAAAVARQTAAVKAMSIRGAGGARDELLAAMGAVLEAERALAASRHEEHAVPLAFPVRWDYGAPLPHLVMNDRRAFLIFIIDTDDPSWDGRSVTIKTPASAHPESLALVAFARCRSAKLGSPNDEVFSGHPLAGKGLEGHSAQLVRNSRWLAELQKVNSVHRGYRAESWAAQNHYVFWFHDTTFECIAESFTVELHACSIPELLADACRRLVA